jgi:hypothetical protein
MGTYFTQDPVVLDALLRGSGLNRQKWWGRADYRGRTIARALDGREQRRRTFSGDRQARTRSSEQPGVSRPTTPPPVFYGEIGGDDPCPGRQKKRRAAMRAVVECLAAAPSRDGAGFTRLPVGAIAAALRIDRKTVATAVRDLVGRGLVEALPARHWTQQGGFASERRARLRVPPAAALAALGFVAAGPASAAASEPDGA